jgi:hypothetical protein
MARDSTRPTGSGATNGSGNLRREAVFTCLLRAWKPLEICPRQPILPGNAMRGAFLALTGAGVPFAEAANDD